MRTLSHDNMPGEGKIWRLWHPDDVGDATRMNEAEWVRLFQPLLLKMVNSDAGRDLLLIDRGLPRIELMTESALHWRTGAENQWQGEFRSGSGYTNTIRYRWPEFKKLAKSFYEHEMHGRRILEPVLNVDGRLVAAHATDTFYPSAAYSAPVDGTAYVVSSYGTWAGIRGAAGAYANEAATFDTVCGYTAGGSTYDSLTRGHVLFNTASIDDAATVSAATFSLYIYAKSTISNQNYTYLLRSNPISTSVLQAADYNTGTTRWPGEGSPMCDDTTVWGSYSTSAYRDFTLNSQGISDISLTSYTKVGVRGSRDATNSAPSISSGVESVTVYFADETGTSKDPKLVVTYTVSTFKPSAIILN